MKGETKEPKPRCGYCHKAGGLLHETGSSRMALYYHPLCWLTRRRSDATSPPEPLAADLIALLRDSADRLRRKKRLHPAMAVVLELAAESIAGQYGVPGSVDYERLLLPRPTPATKKKPERRKAA